LRRRLEELRRAEALGDEFLDWYRDALTAIDESFGPDSNESHDFLGLRFGVPQEALDRLHHKAEDGVPQEFRESLRHSLAEADVQYYQQSLHHADELLLSFQIVLAGREGFSDSEG
jgi:hypothetical protein